MGPSGGRPDDQPERHSPLRSLSSEATLRALVGKLREGIYITSKKGRILDANPAFLEMIGVATIEELSSIQVDELVVPPGERDRELEALARDGSVREYELQLRRPDGEERTVLDTAYAVTDAETGETLYHGILVDITNLKDLERELREQASRDPLTGCYNRRHLNALAERLDTSTAVWSTIVIDIDHFKSYNDRLGHQAGDEVLLKTARYLMNQVRAEDSVCRIGGDEFLVFLPNADRATTGTVVSRLRLEAPRLAPAPFTLGWSVRRDTEPLERTIGRADQELIQVRFEARRFKTPRGDRPPTGS